MPDPGKTGKSFFLTFLKCLESSVQARVVYTILISMSIKHKIKNKDRQKNCKTTTRNLKNCSLFRFNLVNYL